MVINSKMPDILKIVKGKILGLFCSQKIPATFILQTFDTIAALRDAGVTVIGGFHSPMEKECLKILLRGTQPVIVCPARSIKTHRYPTAWKKPIQEGRLALLSDFPDSIKRITSESAEQRNRCVAIIADAVFIPYAAPGSKTETAAKEIVASGKPLYTIEHEMNTNVTVIGAQPIEKFFEVFAGKQERVVGERDDGIR